MAEDTKPGDAPPSMSATDLRTFLIADLRGYTRFTRDHGDEAASRLARRFAALVREVVPAFGGALLELRGDEALCVFGSARQALRASVALQRRLRTPLDDGKVFPLAAGMGLDAGEAVPTEGGYRGDALNLAARLCAIAQPGEILASDAVLHLARHVDGLRLVERRPVRLKGIEKPVRLVEVVPDEPLPALPTVDKPASRRRQLALVVPSLAVLVAIGVWAATRGSSGGSPATATVRVRPNSVAVINATTDRVVADVPMRLTNEAAYGASSPKIAYGDGFVWTYDGPSQTLWRINARTLHAQPFGIGMTPSDVTTSRGRVWLAGGHVITDRNPTSPAEATRIPLPAWAGDPQIAIGRGGLWAVSPPGPLSPTLLKINIHTDKITRQMHTTTPGTNIAARGPSVWIAALPTLQDVFHSGPGNTTVLLPQTASVQGGLALGYRSAWFAGGPGVWKINATPPLVIQDSVPAQDADAIAIGNGAVWVADSTAGQVIRINPYTDKVQRIALGTALGGIAVGGGRVWVAAPG